MIKSALNSFLYVLFPRRCELCGEVTEVDRIICEECENAKRIKGRICYKCGCEKGHCSCKKERFHSEYKGIVAPFYYEGSISRGIKRLKNYAYTELAPAMCREMYKCVLERYKDIKFDVITSVPMHRSKLRSRGYNQSEILAKGLAGLMGAEYRELVEKPYATKSQRFLDSKQRRLNIYGTIFKKDDIDLTGKNVLIVDDVKTTGSTLNECAIMIKGEKADEVYVVSVAITDKKKKS